MKSLILSGLCFASLFTLRSEAQVYATTFEDLNGWTSSTNCAMSASLGYVWSADATPTSIPGGGPDLLPYVSAPSSLNFNNGVDYGGDGFGPDWGGGPGTSYHTCGRIQSPAIDLSNVAGVPLLQFQAFANTENRCGPGPDDTLHLNVLSSTDGSTLFSHCLGELLPHQWQELQFPLDSSWGLIQIEFHFDSHGFIYNDRAGPFIDDLEIVDSCTLDPMSDCSEPRSFCFGDGSGTPCPCSNNSGTGLGQGCVNSSGVGARLIASGAAEVLNDTLRFQLEGAPAASFAFLVSANNALPMTAPGDGLQDYDGLRCVGGNLFRHGARATDASGQAGIATPGWGGSDNPAGGILAQYGFVPGQTRHFQVFLRDDVNAGCGTGGNRSNGVKVTFF